MEVACRNLARQQVAVDRLGHPEIHTDPRLASGIGSASRPVNVFLSKQAATAWSSLNLPAFLAKNLAHLLDAEPIVDGIFHQCARLLDAEDLHRGTAIFVRGYIGERHPDAARGDAVTVE